MPNRFVDFLRRLWHKLIHLQDTPHSIAVGAAIGVFIGFFPPSLPCVKLITAILLAGLLRSSRVAAGISVNWHDICWIITPLLPILIRAEYNLGYWICSNPHVWPPKIRWGDFHKFEHWLNWKAMICSLDWKVMIRSIWPTIVGSAVLALPFAILTFFITLRIVKRHQEKKRLAEAAAADLHLQNTPFPKEMQMPEATIAKGD